MRYKAEITAITPIHIGSGDKALYGLDFFREEKIIKMIDFYCLKERINEIEENLTKIMNLKEEERKARREEKRKIRIRDEVRNIKEKNEKILKDVSRRNPEVVRYPIKSNAEVDRDVETIIKLNSSPYIPGSSIKGALRTAYLYEYGKGKIDAIVKEKVGAALRDRKGIKGIKEALKNANAEIKGEFDEVFKNFVVRDTKEKQIKCSSVYDSKILTRRRGSPHQFLEAIDPGESFITEIIFDESKIKLRDLILCLRNFSSAILNHEKEFFKKNYHYNLSFHLLEGVELEENEALLRLGKGTGHHSKAGWSTFDSYLDMISEETCYLLVKAMKIVREKKWIAEPFPISRRIVRVGNKWHQLGWAKISFERI